MLLMVSFLYLRNAANPLILSVAQCRILLPIPTVLILFKLVKRLSIWFLIFCSGLVFLASILYFSRYALLEALLIHQLQAKNVPLQSFTIDNISLNQVLIRDLSLGTHEELQIDQIDINWNLIDLLKGKLDVV